MEIMWNSLVKELASQVAALQRTVEGRDSKLESDLAALRLELASQGADMASRIERAGLGWAELYDKTLHYLKRIEQRDRTVDTPPQEVAPVVDQITARVNARRMGKRGT